MKFDINIISLIGYVVLAISFGLQVKNNLASGGDKYILMGSGLVVIGYLMTGIHYGINIAGKKLTKINYGHMVLAIYYLFSFLFPINNKRVDSDVLALVGHLLLIKNNDHEFNLVGMASLFSYFVLLIIRLFKDMDSLENKILLGGSFISAAYLNIRIYQNLVKDKIKEGY
jgi:hypothetical protein